MAGVRLPAALAVSSLVVAALLASALAPPRQQSAQPAGCAAVGKIKGWVTVSVGGESSTVEMRSFTSSFFHSLLIALFPSEANDPMYGPLGGPLDVTGLYPAWGTSGSGAPAAVTGGVRIPLTWWRIYYNESGLFLLVGGNATANSDWLTFGTKDAIELRRVASPRSYKSELTIAVDRVPLLPYSFQYVGQPAMVTYTFFFPKTVFTENFVRLLVAYLYNSAAGRVPVTATDGSSVLVDPYTPDPWSAPPGNVPVETYIVLGDGQTQYSPFAYRVQHEIARAKPGVLRKGSPVEFCTTFIALSYAFVFDRDATVTEAAVYVKLSNGKEVMLLYYVFPRPVKVKAGQPFPVAFAFFAPVTSG